MFLCDNYEEGCQTIFRDHDVPAQPSFYINAPQRSDPTAAPEGQDSIMVRGFCEISAKFHNVY